MDDVKQAKPSVVGALRAGAFPQWVPEPGVPEPGGLASAVLELGMRRPPRQGPAYILTLSCPNRRGIVAAVSTFLADAGCDIAGAGQFGDPHSGLCFMRVQFVAEDPEAMYDALCAGFATVAEKC